MPSCSVCFRSGKGAWLSHLSAPQWWHPSPESMRTVADLASWGAMLNGDHARAHVETWACWLPGTPALLLDCWDGEQPRHLWLLGGPWNKQEGLPGSQIGSLGT